ncbi:MAG: hypothetical protein D6707_11605, partial [Bacteroidetes bacterium]
WGAILPVERIVESDKNKIGKLIHASYNVPLAFTGNVLPSPVSKNIKGIWYPVRPAYNAQMTGPIITDENWIPVVKASKTSYTKPVDLNKSVNPELENAYSRPNGEKQPLIFAIRKYKKGRIALINQWPQFSVGSGTKYIFDSQVLTKGYDGRPSDFLKLLVNTLRWLAKPSWEQGTPGGYVTLPEKLLAPNEQPKVLKQYRERFYKYTFAQLNTIPKKNTRLYRGVMGIKTALSSGKGSVKDYAETAKQLGIDFLIFIEDFDKLTSSEFTELKSQCKQYSDDKIKLFPGYCIKNNIGNYMFFYGDNPALLPDYCLTGPDKKTLYIQQTDKDGNYTG